MQHTRRGFLKDVAAGVVGASVGPSLAADLGFSTAFADQGPARLTFGPREALVAIMQETTPERLIPQVVERLRQGTALRDIVAAAALANARTFGGEDYVGFHTIMALAPSFHMAADLPEARRALPVLKVLYRNATRIQQFGGPAREVLRPIAPAVGDRVGGEAVRTAVRARDVSGAERSLAAAGSPEDALNQVLFAVEDGAEVHRTVLPYRAWDLLGIVGREHAHTLLRQSVHYCARAEEPRAATYWASVRTMVPRLLEQHHLLGRITATRPAEDRWIDELSQTIFRATPEGAAEAAAAALAEGMDPAAIGAAISLAANQIILRDNGRATDEAPNKPAGSIHGDSIGLHACDSANAWRNLATLADSRNQAVCLILGAWQAAHDRTARGGSFLTWQPFPREDARAATRDVAQDRLLPALEEAIRGRDQARAAGLTLRYCDSGQLPRALCDVLLKYAVSEDGALHAEKFYRTTMEEFASIRPAFRVRYLVALARVTASEYGYPAPGHADACRLLGI